MQSIDNITILFCEGPHDTAFLYRILKTRGYIIYNDILSNLPKIIGDFIESKNKLSEYNQLKLEALKNEFVPYRIMHKDERLILIYALGGDKDGRADEKNKRLIILRHYFEDIISNVENPSNYGQAFTTSEVVDGMKFKYNFLFFYDADDNKQKKIDIANKYLEKMELDRISLEHQKIHKEKNYSFGLYVFSNDEEKGALEDILFSIMKKDNEKIFDEAKSYYDQNFDKERTRRLVTVFENGIPIDKKKNGYEVDENKSIISIAGQLQKKGKSNVAIIEDSDYLNLSKIQSEKKLQEIANFIEDSAI